MAATDILKPQYTTMKKFTKTAVVILIALWAIAVTLDILTVS